MLLLRIVYDSLSALIQVQNGFNISLLLTSRKDGVGAVIIREKKMCACERDKLLTLFYITPIFFFLLFSFHFVDLNLLPRFLYFLFF